MKTQPRIVSLFQQEESWTSVEIAAELDIPLKLITSHIAKLRQRGILEITGTRKLPGRGCPHKIYGRKEKHD